MGKAIIIITILFILSVFIYFVKVMEEDIKQLIELVKKLGWQIAIPSGGGEQDDGNVHGMIIGEESYVNYILKHLV
jgi:hypothetical protein